MKNVVNLFNTPVVLELGGVKRCVDTIIESSLANEFNFIQAVVNIPSTVKPDVIIWHGACSLKDIVDLVKIRFTFPKAKLLIVEHHYSAGFEKFNPPPSALRFHTMLRVSYRLAERVISISSDQARWMKDLKLAPAAKIEVINSYTDISSFLEIPDKPLHTPLIFGAYGRSHRQKGLDLLLEAVELVPSEYKFKLKICGVDDNYKSERVEVVNHYRSNIQKLVEESDVIVIPSRWEPFGLVCLEARAAGKPIISANIDGLSSQFSDYGFLFEPDNKYHLAQSLREILDCTPTQLKEFSQKARLSVRNSYCEYLKNWRRVLNE